MSIVKNEFEDRNDREYTNGEITVYWKPDKCIHATTCYRELIEVFNPRKRPWVNMEGAPTSEIIRVVDLCPTKALSYARNKPEEGAPQVNNLVTNEVRIMEDGPVVLKGEFTIIGQEGEPLKKMKIASLCRCGHSASMPWCDGTHRKIGFTG